MLYDLRAQEPGRRFLVFVMFFVLGKPFGSFFEGMTFFYLKMVVWGKIGFGIGLGMKI